jgi:Na+-transporting NADH:ubiquinone oxidoreductase subunit A
MLVLVAEIASAQSSGSGSQITTYIIAAVALVLVLFAILSISDNLMHVEAKRLGSDTTKNNFSLFPKLSELLGGSNPAYVSDQPVHKLSKGHTIKLAGVANKEIKSDVKAKTFAVKPTNFRGLAPIPRMLVEVGDEVKAGQPLFEDKKDNRVKYVSPVSGEVVEVRRGAKRSITNVVVLADREVSYITHDVPALESMSREQLVEFMLSSGAWTLLNERPYDVLPNPDVIPANIFISTFDTAPLAPDLSFIAHGKGAAIQKGIDVLSKLTSGNVHVSLNASSEDAPPVEFTGIEGANLHWFSGKHPAGNVGVQIHHIAPIKATDKVWTLTVESLITLGELFQSGQFKADRLIALTGSEFENPSYIKTYQGANIGDLIGANLKEGKSRVIAGDVLSGAQVSKEDFLNHTDNQITAIPEGDDYELFGWLFPVTPRPSVSKTFPNFLFKNHEFEPSTNTHGEKRAFVITGQYESIMPMDIHVMQLMKAIMANDYERMEGLGITELSEEDVALCEFACTSKQPLQKILREGLEMMREQG